MSDNLPNPRMSTRRLTENEAMFRQDNEQAVAGMRQLARLAKEEGHDSLVPDMTRQALFFCECSDENCRDRIKLSFERYSALHKNRKRFVITCGHEVRKVENIVEQTDEFCVVEKHFQPSEHPDGLQPTDVNNV